MNSLLNSDQDEDVADLHRRTPYARDREITLGTTMVLGIFFALAVFAAVCFGLGYSMGAKHSGVTVATTASGPGSSSSFTNFKPAPGSPIGSFSAKQSAADAQSSSLTPIAPIAALPRTPSPRVAEDEAPTEDGAPHAASASGSVLSARPVLARTTAPVNAAPATVPASPAGQFLVQVAAVSHQEDADLLLSTLKRRGYSVAVHTEPQDKLLHVQIGPFTTRKDADAMRQRLLGDGFNAIVKQQDPSQR